MWTCGNIGITKHKCLTEVKEKRFQWSKFKILLALEATKDISYLKYEMYLQDISHWNSSSVNIHLSW